MMRGGNLKRFHPYPPPFFQKGGQWWKDMGKEAVKGAVLQVAQPALIRSGLLPRPRKSLKRGVKRKAATTLSKKDFKKVKRKVIRDIFGK